MYDKKLEIIARPDHDEEFSHALVIPSSTPGEPGVPVAFIPRNLGKKGAEAMARVLVGGAEFLSLGLEWKRTSNGALTAYGAPLGSVTGVIDFLRNWKEDAPQHASPFHEIGDCQYENLFPPNVDAKCIRGCGKTYAEREAAQKQVKPQ